MKKRGDLRGAALLELKKPKPEKRRLEALVGRLAVWLWKALGREQERGE